LDDLPDPIAFPPEAVQKMQRGGHLILDTRQASQYGAGHIPASLHIGLNGRFASWAGSLIKPDIPLLLVAESALTLNRDLKIAAICARGYRSSIATSLLERLGFRNISNVVGGMTAWNNAKLARAS
jgi:rhodanese-related sulfurtransferase